MHIDMVRGVYRKVYSGYLTGRRINAVSMEAEAWFWRLHAIADDFGNLHGAVGLLRALAAPARNVTEQQVDGWNKALICVGLLREYTAGGERFLHIVGFQDFQPANRNGRRIQRYPREDGGSLGNPGESKGVRGNPGESWESKPSESESESESDTDSHTNTGGVGSDAKASEQNGRPVDYYAARAGLSGAWPLPVIDGIIAEYPAAGRRRPMRTRRAVEAALDALRDRGQQGPDTWLLGRVRDYAKSPLGRAGIYSGSASDWFEQARYDEPPEAWERSTPGDKKKPDHGAGATPGQNGTGALARIKASSAEFAASWAGKEPPRRTTTRGGEGAGR